MTCRVLALVFALASLLSVTAQNHENPQDPDAQATLLRVSVGIKAESGNVILVPPATSQKFDLKHSKDIPDSDRVELKVWLKQQTAKLAFSALQGRPWHIVITYDQFDEDGDNVHSGVFEEFWFADDKFKRIYKADDFSQVACATKDGLYQSGDKHLPNPVQLLVRSAVVAPYDYQFDFEQTRGHKLSRTFSGHDFTCIAAEGKMGVSDPNQFCFEPGTDVLRYTRGDYWHQVTYNQFELFEGIPVARQVDVTEGGKPFLKLHVDSLESIAPAEEALTKPGPDAVGPLAGRVSGVRLKTIKMPDPDYPPALKHQHFTITLEIVVGKDGHVLTAKAVSGLPEAYKVAEDAVKTWVFAPYLVLGKPVEVEEKVLLQNN